MKQEDRYTVIKHTDEDAALTLAERTELYRLCTKVLAHRNRAGKAPLRCVVVEHDWPEYGPTWQALAARVDGTSGQTQEEPQSMAWPELSAEEMTALLRFCETCEDGQGYDIPKPMMNALAAIGVLQHMSAGIYAITVFGEAVVEKAGRPAQAFIGSEHFSKTQIPHDQGLAS